MDDAFFLQFVKSGGYVKRFDDRSIALERTPRGNVMLYLVEGGKGEPDASGQRSGTVKLQQYQFTAEEWRQVERALQIAK